MKKILNSIKIAFFGLCMSVANSVPGVSGGTIAMLMGFFDDFVGAFNDVIYSKERRKKALMYVILIGIGWAGGMIGAMLLLDKLFVKYVYAISSLFFGFVLFSIPVMAYDERECLKKKYYNLVWTVLGLALIVGLTYFSATMNIESRNLGNFSFPLAILLFFVGAIAIIAMILPGVSGSTILLVFGVYQPITEGIASVIKFNFKPFPMLCIFGLGALTGAALGIKGIKLCLEKFRSQTVYFVIGMLVASLYSIMMGPVTLDEPRPWMSFGRFNWIFFAIGALIIVGLQTFKILKAKKLAEK